MIQNCDMNYFHRKWANKIKKYKYEIIINHSVRFLYIMIYETDTILILISFITFYSFKINTDYYFEFIEI